ncbi:MAG: lamin tail domain-containing protein, partial [Chitinispirillaceae bacterium]|nr:lamin tail domain-containing protein [Chitinispirillaceae bacterium]
MNQQKREGIIVGILIFLIILCTTKPPLTSDNSSDSDDKNFNSSPIGDIIISEICVDNYNIIKDEDYDDPSWVELYNKADTAINLKGYFLSDDSLNLQKWKFGDYTLKGCLLYTSDAAD